MPSRSIEAALVAAGLVAGLAGGAGRSGSSIWRPATPADTLSAEMLDAVTMEPIRVVVPRDSLLATVTMEPIRVVIPRAGMPPEAPNASPR